MTKRGKAKVFERRRNNPEKLALHAAKYQLAQKKNHDLTQEEIVQGELMSLHIALAAMLHHLAKDQEDPDAVYTQVETDIGEIVSHIPREVIPAKRHMAFRDLVAERGKALVKNARELPDAFDPS